MKFNYASIKMLLLLILIFQAFTLRLNKGNPETEGGNKESPSTEDDSKEKEASKLEEKGKQTQPFFPHNEGIGPEREISRKKKVEIPVQERSRNQFSGLRGKISKTKQEKNKRVVNTHLFPAKEKGQNREKPSLSKNKSIMKKEEYKRSDLLDGQEGIDLRRRVKDLKKLMIEQGLDKPAEPIEISNYANIRHISLENKQNQGSKVNTKEKASISFDKSQLIPAEQSQNERILPLGKIENEEVTQEDKEIEISFSISSLGESCELSPDRRSICEEGLFCSNSNQCIPGTKQYKESCDEKNNQFCKAPFKCIDKVCDYPNAKDFGESCDETEPCKANLFCQDNICTDLMNKRCEKNEDCGNIEGVICAKDKSKCEYKNRFDFGYCESDDDCGDEKKNKFYYCFNNRCKKSVRRIGSYCEKNSHCISKSCVKNQCTFAKGERLDNVKCDAEIDCVYSYKCVNGLCKKTGKAAGEICEYKSECGEGLECIKHFCTIKCGVEKKRKNIELHHEICENLYPSKKFYCLKFEKLESYNTNEGAYCLTKPEFSDKDYVLKDEFYHISLDFKMTKRLEGEECGKGMPCHFDFICKFGKCVKKEFLSKKENIFGRCESDNDCTNGNKCVHNICTRRCENNKEKYLASGFKPCPWIFNDKIYCGKVSPRDKDLYCYPVDEAFNRDMPLLKPDEHSYYCNIDDDCDDEFYCGDENTCVRKRHEAGESCENGELCKKGLRCLNNVCTGKCTVKDKKTGKLFYYNNICENPPYGNDKYICAKDMQEDKHAYCLAKDEFRYNYRLYSSCINHCQGGLVCKEGICTSDCKDDSYCDYLSSVNGEMVKSVCRGTKKAELTHEEKIWMESKEYKKETFCFPLGYNTFF